MTYDPGLITEDAFKSMVYLNPTVYLMNDFEYKETLRFFPLLLM